MIAIGRCEIRMTPGPIGCRVDLPAWSGARTQIALSGCDSPNPGNVAPSSPTTLQRCHEIQQDSAMALADSEATIRSGGRLSFGASRPAALSATNAAGAAPGDTAARWATQWPPDSQGNFARRSLRRPLLGRWARRWALHRRWPRDRRSWWPQLRRFGRGVASLALQPAALAGNFDDFRMAQDAIGGGGGHITEPFREMQRPA